MRGEEGADTSRIGRAATELKREGESTSYGSTITSTCDGYLAVRSTRCVCAV
ncbi:hypothetical protein BH11GEM2_BH11GEM2_39050 [soil metagenome]